VVRPLESGLIRLSPSVAAKEKRLSGLLSASTDAAARCEQALESAWILGSLELSGLHASAAELTAAREGGSAPQAVAGLYSAGRELSAGEPFSARALKAWHRAALGGGEFQWLAAASAQEMKAAQQGALVMARLLEIVPFEDGNGRVARLAAAHLMARAGARRPVLTGADAARLAQALSAAFQLHTEPLVALLEEASERALDVMIAAAEGSRG
jgi:hypothetical protein